MIKKKKSFGVGFWEWSVEFWQWQVGILRDNPFLCHNSLGQPMTGIIAKYYIHREWLFEENRINCNEYLINLKYKPKMDNFISLHNNTYVFIKKSQFIYEDIYT